MSRRWILPLAALSAGALALAGCAGDDADDAASDVIQVVASTNVYADIAAQIGGDAIEVSAIIDSGAQDPHEYEASAQDQLLIERADLVIENGGGYDSFVDQLLEASGSEAVVITVSELSPAWPADAEEHDHEEGEDEHAEEDEDHDHVEGFNEHVWYDPETMIALAEEIAHELGDLDSANAETFEANAADFTAEVVALQDELAAIEAEHSGAQVFVTEPVPVYLIEAAGLVNVAPDEFTEAVEEGQDVPPATLLEAQRLLQSGEVSVLIANAQTGGAETTTVIDEATAAGVPVIEFAETLPDGETYISWMQANISALSAALAG